MGNKKMEFKNPSEIYRGRPFWSWNGKLTKEELLRQIDVIKEMGFGGFFCHSRTGLDTEYLGEEWFDLINDCADYGEKQGLDTWLYDEDRWPSGSAGGMVTKKIENRMKFLKMSIYSPKDEWFDEHAVITFACRLDGFACYDERIISSKEDVIMDNESIVVFRVENFRCTDNYNGYTYADTMNLDTTIEYLQSTHELYKEKCGEEFGKSIQGMFTDEPHRGPLFSTFSEGSNYAVPYTPKLFEAFEERFSYSLKDRLLELFFQKDGEKVSQVTWHYVDLCQQLFIDNFAKPTYEWCDNNNLIYTGHVLHEDSLCNQTVMQGSLMRYYEYMHQPGIDVLTEYNEVYWAVKQLSSVARQIGQKWLLSELYGCTGWHMNFSSHKFIGDWQALFGINFRCPHLSWYTMKGEAKRDYPASIFSQSAWYEDYKYVEDYFARINVAMEQGEPECELLVISPLESIWARCYSGCFHVLDAADEDMIRLEKQYRDTFYALAGNRIDFDYGDEDILGRHGCIDRDQKVLKVGLATYKKVLIAGVDTIRSSTIDLLKEFVAIGGEVIFAGEVPNYMDAVKSQIPAELSKNAHCIELEQIGCACKSGREVCVVGENIESLYGQSRSLGNERFIMLLNTNRKQSYDKVQLNLGIGASIEEWDLTTGEVMAVDYEVRDGYIYVNTSILEGGSKLYHIGSEPTNKAVVKMELQNSYSLNGDFTYTLDERNILVLDQASYSYDQVNYSDCKEVLRTDRAIRDDMGLPYRGGEMMQPWYYKKFHGQEAHEEKPVHLKFHWNIDKLPENDIVLVVEALEDMMGITVNGNPLTLSNSVGTWIDVCFTEIPVSKDMLCLGLNEIEVTMLYGPTTGVEAIYLLGDFGVVIDHGQVTMNSLPNKISIGDITNQGLLFYSGKITYHMPVNKHSDSQKIVLKAENYGGALVKVIGDNDEAVIAWAPYEADVTSFIKDQMLQVQVVLTRRNTFGPLHQKTRYSRGYGPDNFLTFGEDWTDDYVLFEQGLLKAPVVMEFN